MRMPSFGMLMATAAAMSMDYPAMPGRKAVLVPKREQDAARAAREKLAVVLEKFGSKPSRQQRRRAEFRAALGEVNQEFWNGGTTFTVPRAARRRIARNRVRLGRRVAR
jgi:hypothetical protein